MSVVLTCMSCRSSRTITELRFKGMPIEDWWDSVGRQCVLCRMGEVRQPEVAGARLSDPETSQLAAVGTTKVRMRRSSLRHLLLRVYAKHPHGLIDEVAGNVVGRDGAWKRCSELRNMGLIQPTGLHQHSSAGAEQRVCVITDAGWLKLFELDPDGEGE